MMFSPVRNVQPDYMDYSRPMSNGPKDASRSDAYGDGRAPPAATYYPPSSITYVSSSVTSPYINPNSSVLAPSDPMNRPEPFYSSNGYQQEPKSPPYGNGAISSYGSYSNRTSPPREPSGRITPEYISDYRGSPTASDTAGDLLGQSMTRPGNNDRVHQQRRPTNRDEFDGPHQLLPRPPSGYLAEQERDLPHLPTNLVVQEQDLILTRVNDRLSRCAFDFVAKYEFPIPIDSKMRPVERPEDREWTEWVYLLKRLATKRRIPARVLYNGQIKQLVTILENSLEMRHAARNQSRPLKDDRNILQLISAGIQVARILKDASAMDYLDRLYVTTEKQIQERRESHSSRYR